MPSVSQVLWRCYVNGVINAVSGGHVTRGAYGANGSFSVTCPIQSSSLNIQQIAQNVGADARSEVQIQVSTDNGTTWNNLMTGDLDSMDWNFDQDTIELNGRDFSGRLTEQRVVLKNSELTNMTPSQLAVQFAMDAGLTPDVTPIPGEQVIGYLGENNLAIRTATPISKWNLLVLMARLTSRAVWVSSDNPPILYFGPVNFSQTPRPLWYGSTDNTKIPIRHLLGQYRLFKNTTFQVIVMSYHPKQQVQASASVLVLGEEVQYETLKTIPAGTYKGGAAGSLRLQLGNVLRDKPAYIFHAHALNPQQCDTLAEAIARDIAKRQFILKGQIDGDWTVDPLEVVTVTLDPNTPLIGLSSANKASTKFNLGPFSGLPMYVSQVHHTFDMTSGFLTDLSMWYLPSAYSVLSEVPGTGGLTPTEPNPIE